MSNALWLTSAWAGLSLLFRIMTRCWKLKPKFIEIYAARGIMLLHIREWENAKFHLIFASNLRVDVIAEFHKMYEGIADFEQKNNIQLPEGLAAMLRRW